jgi:pimeloyl-ACP methyl ester carboxylesterase
MVMYAHLGRVPDDARVASVVAVASPAKLCPGVVVRIAGVAGRALASSGLRVPAHLPGRVVAPFAFTAPIDLRVAWPPNLTTPSIRRMLVRLLEPLSPTMIGQFTRWIREANFTSEDGADDYAAGLRRIVTPMCFVVGPRDQLAPPSSVRFAYDQIASDVSEFWHVGREEGASIDHCHGSILLGPSAPREVFPIVTGWLDDRVASRPARDVSERPWMSDDQDSPSRSAMQDARDRAIAASAA